MMLSLLQLNINADNFWGNLISYLNQNDFDILHFQEVAGKETFSGNIRCQTDCLEELTKILKPDYHSEFALAQRYTSNLTSYIGNATFYKKSFTLINKKIVQLHERTTPFPSDATSFEEAGRNLLHLILQKEDKTISFLNTHLAWAKTTKEQPHQTAQGEILFNYLQTIPHPFVLSGDFNIDPEQPLIQKINGLARNLTTENNVITTLNPRTHQAKVLFPPGAAVDYIFTTKEITVKEFSVVTEDVSDHLGLTAKIEI